MFVSDCSLSCTGLISQANLPQLFRRFVLDYRGTSSFCLFSGLGKYICTTYNSDMPGYLIRPCRLVWKSEQAVHLSVVSKLYFIWSHQELGEFNGTNLQIDCVFHLHTTLLICCVQQISCRNSEFKQLHHSCVLHQDTAVSEIKVSSSNVKSRMEKCKL